MSINEKLIKSIESLEISLQKANDDLAHCHAYLSQVKDAVSGQKKPTPAQEENISSQIPTADKLVENLTKKVKELEQQLHAATYSTNNTPSQEHKQPLHWEKESTLEMLERMKSKVDAEQELGKLYERMHQQEQVAARLDAEMTKTMEMLKAAARKSELEELKRKMGIKK